MFSRIDGQISPADLMYDEVNFKNMTIRKILYNKEPNGTYHVKSPLSKDFLINVIKSEMPYAKVVNSDPENYLKLDFPIFIDSKESTEADMTHFEKIDEKVTNHLNEMKGR